MYRCTMSIYIVEKLFTKVSKRFHQLNHSGESRPVDIQNCIACARRREGFLPTSLYYSTVNYLTYPGVKPHLHDILRE